MTKTPQSSEKVVYEDRLGRYRQLEHMSDVYIEARGRDLLELFENSGIALFDTMVDTQKVSPMTWRSVEAEGFDMESLLYKWLESLLTLYYAERLVCSNVVVERFVVEKRGPDVLYRVEGKCGGERFDPQKHEGRVEVKAATYSLMEIGKKDTWFARFVLDI